MTTTLPPVAAGIERSMERLQPMIREMKAVRMQIPAILEEVQAVRGELPEVAP